MYTISELAQQFNTSHRTLRYYEERGITEPVTRVNGQRKYSKEDVARLDVAFHLRHYDVAVDDIADLLNADISAFAGVYDAILRESRDRLVYEIAHRENALFDLEGEMAARGVE